MGVDITTELNTIANASSGSLVKGAIYNALLKIADAGSKPEGGAVIGNVKMINNGKVFTIVGNAEYTNETEGI